MPGLFVTLEGGEGSGKSTQLGRLAERLRRMGLDPLVTREPGGTPLGEGIRELLLAPGRVPVPIAEAMLLAAARAQHVAAVIRPALAAGRVVLCDRFTDSTLAYQGGGRGVDRALLEAFNRAATGDLIPDLTLLFDLPAGAGLDRRAAAPGVTNRLDREPGDFHERVRAAYQALAVAEPGRIVLLDAAGAPDGVEAQAWTAIQSRLASARIAGREPAR